MKVGQLRFNNVRASSVATPVVSPSSPGSKAARTTKIQESQIVSQITADDVKDPERLARVISDIQRRTQAATFALRSNLEGEAVYFQKQNLVSGKNYILLHNLGRPYVGYVITRAYPGAQACTLVESAANTLSNAGLAVSQAIAWTPTGTGTYDIKVF